MKRFFGALLFAALFCHNTLAQGFVTVAPPNQSTLRQIATHTFLPDGLIASGTATIGMSRTKHVSGTATPIQTVDVGFYNTTEVAVPGTATIARSIEYPPGTCTQVKWSGATSATVPSGGILVSDASISVPAGSVYYERIYYQNSSGVPTTTTANNAGGEGFHYGTSGISDQTVTCDAITNTTSGSALYPAALIGMSASPAVCILGDSLNYYLDTYAGGNLDVGIIARALGTASVSYLTLAIKGITLNNIISAHTGKVALAAYCSSLVQEGGLNDYVGGASPATVLARMQTVYGYFTIPIWQTTTTPVTTSSDNWTTIANEATVASTANRQAGNTTIRAGVAGVRGFIDSAFAVEVDSSNAAALSGGFVCVAAAQNVANYCSQDGTHYSAIGYLRASGAVSAGVFP